ncbi:MAG: ABC transporter ATP-binding protein [Actinomycetota bacterium]|nr:ABC transporter ATP-binding protein [Actinomycetota bacterium]
MESESLLSVRDLHVRFSGDAGTTVAVDGVSFDLRPDEVLGIVGESGSGKSATVMGMIGLLDPSATTEGEVLFGARNLLEVSEAQLRRVRGGEIAMVFQDPMTSLNPVYRVGWQIAEQLREHTQLSEAAIQDRVIELLRSVGLPDADQRVHDFPHQLSGGMRQRVMIALALSCDPKVLIADEPTTALDVTIQAQILDLIRILRVEHRSSVILITHDMGVIAEMAERVIVMYGGKVVEQSTTTSLFGDPLHPYTWGLLGSIPRLGGPRPRRLSAIAPASAEGVDTRGACVFASRCPHRFEPCAQMPPLVDRRGDEHFDACHLPVDQRPTLRERALARFEAAR